jgi:two-component system sensor histidine kinase/response regulator
MEMKPATILVIDDELGIREGCRRVLAREGHQVFVAATGEEGWEQVQSGQFDLVLLDVMMPDIGGMELLERIVAFDPDLVCIIITGYATIELAVQAIKQGAYDFIAKPFDANTLLLTVQQGLERRRLVRETKRLAQVEAENEALERRKAELEELDRVKSSFTLTVAHELRAPVAAIQSYLRLILGGYIPPEQQRQYLVRVEQRASAQLELISDLLDLARLQNPDLRIKYEPVNVAQSLREVCDLMSGHAQEKQIDFTVSIPDTEITVTANPKHITQLWDNLVSNAIKYTKEGGAVDITMTVQEKQVVTTVRDTGIGIAPEDLTRIFEEFYRTKAAKALSQMGTGLGLALVKQIVETYHGKVDVQSTVGEGSTFTVALPIDTGKPPSTPPAPEQEEEGEGGR